MAYGRWSIPVVDWSVAACDAEAHHQESYRIFTNSHSLSMQAKLFVHGSIVHVAFGRLAREKVLGSDSFTCSWLLRLSVGYGIFLRSYSTTDFTVRHSIYGCRRLSKLWDLARYSRRILLDVSIKLEHCTTARY